MKETSFLRQKDNQADTGRKRKSYQAYVLVCQNGHNKLAQIE